MILTRVRPSGSRGTFRMVFTRAHGMKKGLFSDRPSFEATYSHQTGDATPGNPLSQKLGVLAALLIVVDHLRCRFARFKSATGRTRCGELGAHLLQGRGKRFNLLLLLYHGPWPGVAWSS